MAQWTKVLLFLALPCVNASRIYQTTDSEAQPSVTETTDTPGVTDEMNTAMNDWFSKHKYRYVIMEVPEKESDPMTGHTAPMDRNYADFLDDLTQCPGLCIAAYEFSWEVERGTGFVGNSEP